jgi:CBS domain-containing protein
MGLAPNERGPLEAGLLGLRIIRDMPPCVSGTPFVWPTVVFQTADEAGNAVAVALQDATCTFTVAPSPTPVPTPVPTPGVVSNIRLTAGAGTIELTWTAPPAAKTPTVDYRVRCRAGSGDWIESTEGVSLETTATVSGLTNGTPYSCEVAAVGASADGAFTAASTTATPMALPPTPGKPSVARLDRALQISVPPADAAQVSGYRYECSADSGRSWPVTLDVSAADNAAAQIGGLKNGVGYVCRAFAVNLIGTSGASPLSDPITPCGSTLECNPLLAPILVVLGLVGIIGVLAVVFAVSRGRTRGYVVAVVDVVHTANLGHGSSLGISFVRAPHSKSVTEIVPDRSRKTEIRIRPRGGDRFVVIDREGRHDATSGEPIIVVDSVGVKHGLVLWAFATNSALAASGRR